MMIAAEWKSFLDIYSSQLSCQGLLSRFYDCRFTVGHKTTKSAFAKFMKCCSEGLRMKSNTTLPSARAATCRVWSLFLTQLIKMMQKNSILTSASQCVWHQIVSSAELSFSQELNESCDINSKSVHSFFFTITMQVLLYSI